MVGALEATESGDFFDRGVWIGQQAGGALEPRLDEPCLRRQAGVRLEQAGEVIRVEPAGTRPIHDGDVVAEAFLDPTLRGEYVMDGVRIPPRRAGCRADGFLQLRQPLEDRAGGVEIPPPAFQFQSGEDGGEHFLVRFPVLQAGMARVGVPQQHVRGVIAAQREAGGEAGVRLGRVMAGGEHVAAAQHGQLAGLQGDGHAVDHQIAGPALDVEKADQVGGEPRRLDAPVRILAPAPEPFHAQPERGLEPRRPVMVVGKIGHAHIMIRSFRRSRTSKAPLPRGSCTTSFSNSMTA